MAALKLDLGENFLSVRVVRGDEKKIVTLDVFGLQVCREEELRERNHLFSQMVLGRYILAGAQ